VGQSAPPPLASPHSRLIIHSHHWAWALATGARVRGLVAAMVMVVATAVAATVAVAAAIAIVIAIVVCIIAAVAHGHVGLGFVGCTWGGMLTLTLVLPMLIEFPLTSIGCWHWCWCHGVAAGAVGVAGWVVGGGGLLTLH